MKNRKFKICKNDFKIILKKSCSTVAILFVVLVGMYHSSCQLTPEGITLVSREDLSPKIKSFSADGENVSVIFSKKIKIEETFAIESSSAVKNFSSSNEESFAAKNDTEKNARFSIDDFMNVSESEKILVDSIVEDFENQKCKVDFKILSKTQIGKNYELYCKAKDEKGNTLSFTIPFMGENKNFPRIVISEISDKYEKKSNTVEYVELYALSDGNLFGLELVTASDEKIFSLPCVEVKKGNYILVHLRSLSEENESATNSEKVLSLQNPLDIWIKNTESALSPSAEILILKNKPKNKIVDALAYCTSDYLASNSDWKSDNLKKYSALLESENVWSAPVLPQNAVYSKERKSMTYISRTNIADLVKNPDLKNDSSNWIGTTKSNSSPGKENVIR